MDKYKNKLLNVASKFDAVTDANGEVIQIVNLIVESDDENATIKLLKNISHNITDKKENKIVVQLGNVLKDLLIEYFGYKRIIEICKPEQSEDDNRTLDELLQDLNDLVGLFKVKQQVKDLIAYQKVQKMRKLSGLSVFKKTLHLAFLGNPGTGKTTVARIVGHVYKQLGLLSKGHFIEVSRTDLIAGYQGQTALKVKKVIERAKGSVLFIDEAYSITENEHSDSYGRECLTELTKALEDYRDDLVVIVAGYTEPMKQFFESNPGLKSRFNTFIEFPDYNEEELWEILESMCLKNNYVIETNAEQSIKTFLSECVKNKNENFANGRLVRNIFDDLIMSHARRVVNIENPTKNDLSLIIGDDFSRK